MTVTNISIQEAFKEYERNKIFRDIILSETFLYIDDEYIYNDPKYIYYKNGKPRLTDYAEEHIEECALLFDQDIEYTVYKTSTRADEDDDIKIKSKKTLSDKNKKWIDLIIQETVRAAESEINFWDKLMEIIKTKNARDFEKITLLNKSTYYKYMDKDKRPKTVELSTIMAIAVGYNLTLYETENLMRLAGLSFIPNNTEHAIYKFLLAFLRGYGTEKCNEILDDYNIEILGSVK